MKPSAFAPHGLLQLKGGTSAAQALHASIVELFSDGSEFALSTELGSFVDCLAFSLARVLGRLQLRQQKLDRERLAFGAYELLGALEEEHGLTPAFGDTIPQRRAALLAAFAAAQGSRRAALEQALGDLHGDDYVGLHVQSTAEVSIWPSSLGDSPMLLAVPEMPRKVVRLPNAVSAGLGAPQYIAYIPVDPAPTDPDEHTLLVGDQIVVGVDNLGLAETVEITDVEQSGEGEGSLLFEATLSKAKDPGTIGAAMPMPAWGSSQRHLIVVLSETAALDAEARRKTHVLLGKMVTGMTTWSICPASAAAQAGPLTLDHTTLGRLDCNPMDTVSVP